MIESGVISSLVDVSSQWTDASSVTTVSAFNGDLDTAMDERYRRESFALTIVPSGPVNPPVVEIYFADAKSRVGLASSKLQSAPSVTGPWTDVTFIPGRGQPPQPAQSPFTTQNSQPMLFCRMVD